MDSEIVGALIAATATILAAVIGGIVAIVVKSMELKAKERKTGETLTRSEKQTTYRLWGIGGAIIGAVVILGAAVSIVNLLKPSSPVPFYRYHNPSSGDHFYTTDPNPNLAGWNLEDIQGYVYPKEKPGTVPLFAYYNSESGQHFYTTKFDELGKGGKGEWKLEGTAAYVYPQQRPETVPLYRYLNPETGGHFYTTDFNELGNGRNGWQFEEIECYIYAAEPRRLQCNVKQPNKSLWSPQGSVTR